MNNILKLGIMGLHGSFSEQAAISFINNPELNIAQPVELIPLTDAFHVMDALRKAEIDMGVLATRNSIFGAVKEFHETYNEDQVLLLASLDLPIHQCLFKRKDIAVSELTAVASHPQALGQTRNTRQLLFPQLIEQEAADTALSAMWLANGKLPVTCAVICSKQAGEIYGLDLIRENLEDHPGNTTSFCLICPK